MKNIQMVSFGQPRIGNSVFAEYFNMLLPNTYRITHAHDMVPHLPPYYSIILEGRCVLNLEFSSSPLVKERTIILEGMRALLSEPS